MEWFNVYGIIFMALILIPNIIYGIKCKAEFENKWNNKVISVLEQIGRYGCMAFMIFNIPKTWFGFQSNEVFALYLIINAVLIVCYIIIWIVTFRKNNLFKAVSLSVIPSVIFLLSGILSRSVLLISSAIIFAPCHVLISCKNVRDKYES